MKEFTFTFHIFGGTTEYFGTTDNTERRKDGITELRNYGKLSALDVELPEHSNSDSSESNFNSPEFDFNLPEFDFNLPEFNRTSGKIALHAITAKRPPTWAAALLL